MRRSAMALLSSMPALAAAQDSGQCISLQDSKTCPAFQSASISTSESLINTLYAKLPTHSRLLPVPALIHPRCSPFLQFVSDTSSFDNQLSTYVQTTYVKDRYARASFPIQNTPRQPTADTI